MNNLEPSIWGPHYWNTLHFAAATYDRNPNKSVRTVMKDLIKSLPVILPCKDCQDNAMNFIQTADVDKAVSSRKELFLFFFDFHNRVNQRLRKPLMNIQDALKIYHIPKEEYTLYINYSDKKSKAPHQDQGVPRPHPGGILIIAIALSVISFVLWTLFKPPSKNK